MKIGLYFGVFTSTTIGILQALLHAIGYFKEGRKAKNAHLYIEHPTWRSPNSNTSGQIHRLALHFCLIASPCVKTAVR